MADSPEASEQGERLWLFSDFNLGNLHRLLENADEGDAIQPASAPMGTVVQSLLDDEYASDGSGALVWTQPEAVLPSFGDLLRHNPVDPDDLSRDVEEFCSILKKAAQKRRFLLVPTWVAPRARRGMGMLDLQSQAGVSAGLLRANSQLADGLRETDGVFVLDAERWWLRTDRTTSDASRLWYRAKIPFPAEVFREAARDIRAAIAGLNGRSRKLVVVDLDNTLWGGIVGDVGWENLRLGGHDAVGEAFVDFQRSLAALTNRGIILAIASKNDEHTAMEAIREHPEMVLREKHFAAWRINWDDKAQNIVEIVQELNIGLDSVVFLDDNPAERARVGSALPDVLVPEWPDDPMLFAETLRGLRCFDAPALSEEDISRARMYVSERERREMLDSVESVDEWVRNLGIRVTAAPLGRPTLKRAAQLLNKTNQMNLSTRRLTEAELWSWADADHHSFWTVEVEDRFGEYGLCGLVSIEESSGEGRVVDFVLSCRVFGRSVEETMLHVLVQHGRERGLERLFAEYKETKKNGPCLEFWRTRSGFEESDEGRVFSFDLDRSYPVPEPVDLRLVEDAVPSRG